MQDNCLKNNLSGVNVALSVCYSMQGNGIFDYVEDGIVTTEPGNIKKSDIIGHQYLSTYIHSHNQILRTFQILMP